MKFYNVKDEYIQYLKLFDDKVADNKVETRPYVGVVIEINEIKYYAPFASPKPKHRKMKNSKDFRKIKQGEYGAINFNNMLPVNDDALLPIDIEHLEDEKYKRLLQNQYNYIRADQAQIMRSAKEVRRIAFAQDGELTNYDKIIKNRTCDLPLLEDACKRYMICQ